MLNLKPIRFEHNGETRFGISVEWSDLSAEEVDYDGLRVWNYTTDLRYVIHEIESESKYYMVLADLLAAWGSHITATNSNDPGSIDAFKLVGYISDWMTGKGYRLV